MNGGKEEQIQPEPTSYAEAVKEEPVDVERREAQEAKQAEERQRDTESSEKENGEGHQPTPAGDLTFAEALKEGHAKTDDADGEKADSQASTTVEYPEIQSDEDEEENVRRRDRENASEVLSLRWAPLRVPFKRRLQTLAVLSHCLGIGLSLSIFFFGCAFIPLWPISKCYQKFPPSCHGC